MCGRFTACFEFRDIKLLFNLQRDTPLLSPRYNIAPFQEVPVIVHNGGVNCAVSATELWRFAARGKHA